jgi:hypothetical protein
MDLNTLLARTDGRSISGALYPIRLLITISSDFHLCSGFTGESSMAIVSQDEACLFVDGRYHVSASKEIDANWTLYKVGVEGVPTWSMYLEVS